MKYLCERIEVDCTFSHTSRLADELGGLLRIGVFEQEPLIGEAVEHPGEDDGNESDEDAEGERDTAHRRLAEHKHAHLHVDAEP